MMTYFDFRQFSDNIEPGDPASLQDCMLVVHNHLLNCNEQDACIVFNAMCYCLVVNRGKSFMRKMKKSGNLIIAVAEFVKALKRP